MSFYRFIKYGSTLLLGMIFSLVSGTVLALTIRPTSETSVQSLSEVNNSGIFVWENIVNIHMFIFIVSAIGCTGYIIIWKYIYPKKVLVPKFLKSVSIFYGILITSMVALPILNSYLEKNITEECLMNGFGQGKCTFTNLGSTKAYKCGSVEVKSYTKNEVRISNIFCSGDIPRKDTKVVEFTIPGIADICKPATGGKWSDECNLSFMDAAN